MKLYAATLAAEPDDHIDVVDAYDPGHVHLRFGRRGLGVFLSRAQADQLEAALAARRGAEVGG